MMNDFIPYGRQNISSDDIHAVLEVLQSQWLTQGPVIEQFEKAIANYCGVNYAVAVANATAGLHLSCLALNVKKGDKVWTSPNTFVASANCALYCQADVNFVDIHPQTYNLDINLLKEKLEEAKQSNSLPKVVIPVHFAGQSCLMDEIYQLAQSYGFKIIEDASHAIGGYYQNNPIGCCQYSDLAVFSFHPVKIITTGEGGMILTNRKELYDQLIQLRTHGITRNPQFLQDQSQGGWYYEQLNLGYNYRITDLQSALGLSQLKRLDDFVKKRQILAKNYDQKLADLPLILPKQHPDTASSWHLYVIQLFLEKLSKNRQQIFQELREVGIGVNVHYIPVHTQPYYQKLGFQWGDFPNAETYYQRALTLPLYYDLSEEQQDYIINALRKILQ